ncbi:hypothetical protein [Cohnella lupini]|uniref:YhfM-like domain-containing protein n=1 Tax=Cohnella lupini TaxID=1294267 RepID=A0A3D9IX55_9BACL|nr:hypothetical protein [Cohnella lupini]RED66187.1 hypothetical protein DFP95_101685 [Cohnella lupini]
MVIRIIPLMILLLVITTGCSEGKKAPKSSIASITLECPQSKSNQSCGNKSFSDPRSIQVFEVALDSKVELQGELNYVAEFDMTLEMSDKTNKKYHLSLGSNRSNNALLVDQANTNQGYEIPVKNANEIRDLLE